MTITASEFAVHRYEGYYRFSSLAARGGVANATFYSLSAIYAVAIGLTPGEIAVFVAIVLVAPSISQIPLGAMADRYTRMGVAAGCAITAILACTLLINLGNPTLWMICMAGAMVGGAMVPMFSFGLSRIVDHTDSSDVVLATSAGLLAYHAGAFIGPVIAGLTMVILGPTGLYTFLLAVGVYRADSLGISCRIFEVLPGNITRLKRDKIFRDQ